MHATVHRARRRQRSFAKLLCELLALVGAGGNSLPPGAAGHAEFEAEVEARFYPVRDALSASHRSGKPLMILQTLKGCGACMALKRSVNTGMRVRGLLHSFVAVHVSSSELHSEPVARLLGGLSVAPYYPAAYFLVPGGGLELAIVAKNGHDPKYARSFASDEELGSAMAMALKLAGERQDRRELHALRLEASTDDEFGAPREEL